MKVKLLFAFSVVMLFAACQEKPVSPNTPYIIEGEVTKVKDGVEIVLYQFDSDYTAVPIVTDTVKGGKFHFEQVMQDVELNFVSIRVKEGEILSAPCAIYVAPGAHIKVGGHDNYVFTWDVESKVPDQLANNEILNAARAEYEEYMEKTIASNNARDALHKIDRKEEPERYKEAYSLYKEINEQMSSIFLDIQGKQLEKMKTMKPSNPYLRELRTMALMAGASDDFKYRDEVIALYESLPLDIKQSEQGQKLYALLYPPKQVMDGDDFPDADLYDLDGNLHHIAECKGKYILLDFWSNGCAPCIKAFPEMKEMYEKYGDKLAIISMSIDTDRRWRKASEKHDITWNNWNELKGEVGLYANYHISAIPYYVLINPEGKIVKQTSGYGEGKFKTMFSELFDK